MSEKVKKILLKILNEKKKIERYEDIIESFPQKILKQPDYKLKKTKFAEHLLIVMRRNFSKSEGRREYPFEKIIGKFINKIQAKRFPINNELTLSLISYIKTI